MKHRTIVCILFMLLTSCAVKKLQRPTTVVDIDAGAKVEESSIDLERGKICYLYTSQYNDQNINKTKLKNISNSSFFPAKGWSENASFYGSATSLSKIDTVIKDDQIVRMTLDEALRRSPIGSQFQFVPQEEFTDQSGAPDISFVHKKFNPDIIIDLKSLSLKLKGDANIGTNIAQSAPGNTDIGTYSSTSPYTNYYGNVLMDYTALWEVQDVKENKIKKIKQSGRYVSVYYENYSLQKEILSCSQKIGREFSSLIKGYTLQNVQ